MDICYASDDAYVVSLAFLAFGNINIEYSPQTLRPRHPPCMVRFIRLSILYIYKLRAVLASLGCGDLRTRVAIRCENAELAGKSTSR